MSIPIIPLQRTFRLRSPAELPPVWRQAIIIASAALFALSAALPAVGNAGATRDEERHRTAGASFRAAPVLPCPIDIITRSRDKHAGITFRKEP